MYLTKDHGHDKHQLGTQFQRPDRIHTPIYILTPVFNPIRYRSRWREHEDWKKRAEKSGAIFYEVEVAIGERDFVFTEPGNPKHLQLRTKSELWLKENMINLLERCLPRDWQYLGWVDGDVTPVRDDWANETIHQLQHYDVVQMWSQYQDLSPDHEVIGTARSFMDLYLHGGPPEWFDVDCHYPYASGTKKRRGYPGAPGLAWACTRRAWQTFGGLLDVAILGACDWYMAHALIGQVHRVMRTEYSKPFRNMVYEWQERALMLKKNVGVVKGTYLHHWHGPKKDRKYSTRDQILIEAGFDPYKDLKRNTDGLYELTDRSIELRDGIRRYFRERNEDAI